MPEFAQIARLIAAIKMYPLLGWVPREYPVSTPVLLKTFGVVFDLQQKTIVLFVKTAVGLRSQRPLHIQWYAGHPG
jgi:hypothetical protein